MSERITVKDVRAVYERFVECADKLGFDTELWRLEEGNQFNAYRLYVLDLPGYGHGTHPMADHIGSTAKEAYNWLHASVRTMSALLDLPDTA